jgi:endonuclease G, mitochondrial
MDKLEKAKRLKDMLSQIAGRQGLESIASTSARASSGLESVSPEGTNVRSGLEKLAGNRHQDITPNEMFGLEAIVMKENRPVVFVRGNSYDDVGAPWSSLNTPEVKTRLSGLFPLIGRIELPTSTLVP